MMKVAEGKRDKAPSVWQMGPGAADVETVVLSLKLLRLLTNTMIDSTARQQPEILLMHQKSCWSVGSIVYLVELTSCRVVLTTRGRQTLWQFALLQRKRPLRSPKLWLISVGATREKTEGWWPTSQPMSRWWRRRSLWRGKRKWRWRRFLRDEPVPPLRPTCRSDCSPGWAAWTVSGERSSDWFLLQCEASCWPRPLHRCPCSAGEEVTCHFTQELHASQRTSRLPTESQDVHADRLPAPWHSAP